MYKHVPLKSTKTIYSIKPVHNLIFPADDCDLDESLALRSYSMAPKVSAIDVPQQESLLFGKPGESNVNVARYNAPPPTRY